jgi:hypothetical protein
MTFIRQVAGRTVLGAAMLLGLSALPASAGYVVDLTEQGGNVVATGSGSFDLTGLTFDTTFPSASADLIPNLGFVNTGASDNVDGYSGFTGPTSFGSGGVTFASTSTGESAEIIGTATAPLGIALLFVPQGYVSNTTLSNTATYNGATFASLGATPGVYEWSWGNGANQNFTLVIGEVPEPSSWLMLMLGFAGLGFAGYCASRKTSAA